jgi:hypothetical protein
MELFAALIIGRRVLRVERQAKRARELEAGFKAEVRIRPFEIEGRAVQACQRQMVGVCIPTSVRGGVYFFLPGKAVLEFPASDRPIAAVQAKTANYPNNAEM